MQKNITPCYMGVGVILEQREFIFTVDRIYNFFLVRNKYVKLFINENFMLKILSSYEGVIQHHATQTM